MDHMIENFTEDYIQTLQFHLDLWSSVASFSTLFCFLLALQLKSLVFFRWWRLKQSLEGKFGRFKTDSHADIKKLLVTQAN